MTEKRTKSAHNRDPNSTYVLDASLDGIDEESDDFCQLSAQKKNEDLKQRATKFFEKVRVHETRVEPFFSSVSRKHDENLSKNLFESKYLYDRVFAAAVSFSRHMYIFRSLIIERGKVLANDELTEAFQVPSDPCRRFAKYCLLMFLINQENPMESADEMAPDNHSSTRFVLSAALMGVSEVVRQLHEFQRMDIEDAQDGVNSFKMIKRFDGVAKYLEEQIKQLTGEIDSIIEYAEEIRDAIMYIRRLEKHYRGRYESELEAICEEIDGINRSVIWHESFRNFYNSYSGRAERVRKLQEEVAFQKMIAGE